MSSDSLLTHFAEVSVIPTPDWEPTDKAKASLLGISVRVCNPALALENVWHILEVLESSPAEVSCSCSSTSRATTDIQMAGLVPFGDWICGWAGGPLHGENSFYDLVEAVSYSMLANVLTFAAHRQASTIIRVLS